MELAASHDRERVGAVSLFHPERDVGEEFFLQALVSFVLLRFFLNDLLENPLTMATVVIGLIPVILGVVYLVLSPKLFLLIFKNLGRNLLRTALTCLAIMVLVFMVTMTWTIVFSLERFTQERDTNFKLIISEKWSLPSMMRPKFADYLNPNNSAFILDKKDVGPKDFMTWSFYGGTIDPTRPNSPGTDLGFQLFDIRERRLPGKQ